MTIRINFAESTKDFISAKNLFLEYAESLDFSLSFQNFEEEIECIPGKYKTPNGCIILAWETSDCIGCVCMRPLNDFSCEIKRLYVRPPHRGIGIGRLMTKRIIRYCREKEYTKIHLDTTTGMQSAIKLYKSIGFVETEPYYNNPLPNVIYFELDLINPTK